MEPVKMEAGSMLTMSMAIGVFQIPNLVSDFHRTRFTKVNVLGGGN
jgi:ABC-type spermidine/putrescine transport system permease subunit I